MGNRLMLRSPLGERVTMLAEIGDPTRPLGPDAAIGVGVQALDMGRHYNLRLPAEHEGRPNGALGAVEAVLGTNLPTAGSWSVGSEGRTVVWLGPDEWLTLEPMSVAPLEAALREALTRGRGAVTEQTGQQISLLVHGDAYGLLAKGTALDLSERTFTVGSALQGYLAQSIAVYIARADGIEILVRSSFARYVVDWLLDAAAAPLATPASSRE